VEIVFLDSAQNTVSSQAISLSDSKTFSELGEKPNPVLQIFRKKQRLNKKITAAALAFPFPFGIVGLHRIYLGTKPYVPVTYIASLGGGFGVLPLIDFFVIAFSKDITPYRDSGKVFMWVK
jgi:TM2 domain-containing membrane protein YozV